MQLICDVYPFSLLQSLLLSDPLIFYLLNQCFSTFFWFSTPSLSFLTIRRHPYYQFTCKYQSNLEIGCTPRVFQGTLGFRGTPVENHCSKLSFSLSTFFRKFMLSAVNFINVFHTKVLFSSYILATKSTFVWKTCAKNIDEIDSWSPSFF